MIITEALPMERLFFRSKSIEARSKCLPLYLFAEKVLQTY